MTVAMFIATRRIRQMAAALKLKPHHIDAANRIYKLALQRNFTNGDPHLTFGPPMFSCSCRAQT